MDEPSRFLNLVTGLSGSGFLGLGLWALYAKKVRFEREIIAVEKQLADERAARLAEVAELKREHAAEVDAMRKDWNERLATKRSEIGEWKELSLKLLGTTQRLTQTTARATSAAEQALQASTTKGGVVGPPSSPS